MPYSIPLLSLRNVGASMANNFKIPEPVPAEELNPSTLTFRKHDNTYIQECRYIVECEPSEDNKCHWTKLYRFQDLYWRVFPDKKCIRVAFFIPILEEDNKPAHRHYLMIDQHGRMIQRFEGLTVHKNLLFGDIAKMPDLSEDDLKEMALDIEAVFNYGDLLSSLLEDLKLMIFQTSLKDHYVELHNYIFEVVGFLKELLIKVDGHPEGTLRSKEYWLKIAQTSYRKVDWTVLKENLSDLVNGTKEFVTTRKDVSVILHRNMEEQRKNLLAPNLEQATEAAESSSSLLPQSKKIQKLEKYKSIRFRSVCEAMKSKAVRLQTKKRASLESPEI